MTDRIALRWQADGELAEALREHGDLVAAEVLATSLAEGPGDGPVHADADLGLHFTVTRSAP